MKISEKKINEILDKVSLIDIASKYTNLKLKGNKYWGCCPFHGEKTPSFIVSPEKNQFYCFGCQEGGGLIGFVQKIEKLSYIDALKFLANFAGINIDEYTYDDNFNRNKQEYYSLYDFVNTEFKTLLKKRDEKSFLNRYLKERNLSEEIIDEFELGYSFPDKNMLWNLLLEKKYSPEFIKNSGIFSRNYNKLPLFSDRLMFPIFDKNRKVIAFGGRILSGDGPKYINSSETDFFKKKNNFYTSKNGLSEIRKNDKVYIVEGYMDVIGMYKAGIVNCVASLGTAFTDEHAKNLSKMCKTAYLLFDTDTAGKNATLKTLFLLEKNSITTYIISDLNGNKDPEQAVEQLGREKFLKLLKNSINSLDFLISYYINQYDVSKLSENKDKIATELYKYVDILDSPIKKEEALKNIAESLEISTETIMSDYKKSGSVFDRKIETKNNDINIDKIEIDYNKLFANFIKNNEEYFFIILAINFTFYPKYRAYINFQDIKSKKAIEIFLSLENCYRADKLNFKNILDNIDDHSIVVFLEEKERCEEYKLSCKTDEEFEISSSKINELLVNFNFEKDQQKIEKIQHKILNCKDNTILKKLIKEKIFLEKKILTKKNIN